MLWTYHTATLYAGHAATHEIGCKQFLQQNMTVFLYTNYTAQTGMCEENRTYSFFARICGWIGSQNTGLVYLGLLVGRVVAVVSYPSNIWILLAVLWKPLIGICKYDVKVINKVFMVLFLSFIVCEQLSFYHFSTRFLLLSTLSCCSVTFCWSWVVKNSVSWWWLWEDVLSSFCCQEFCLLVVIVGRCPEQFPLVTVFQLFLDILVCAFTYFWGNILSVYWAGNCLWISALSYPQPRKNEP